MVREVWRIPLDEDSPRWRPGETFEVYATPTRNITYEVLEVGDSEMLVALPIEERESPAPRPPSSHRPRPLAEPPRLPVGPRIRRSPLAE